MPARALHRRTDKNSAVSADADSITVQDTKKRAPISIATIFLGTLGLLGVVAVLFSSESTVASLSSSSSSLAAALVTEKESQSGSLLVKKTQRSGPPPPLSIFPDFSPAVAKYDNCVVGWKPPSAKPGPDFDTKPLWLPSYPGSGATSPSGNGDIMKPLINGITGLRMGGKFYHASGKGLKRCKNELETATCANQHPMVPVGPEGQANNFHRSVLVLIRNLVTVTPQQFFDKQQAYHKATGQVPENDWRQVRDTWFPGFFAGWKSIVMTWKEELKNQYEIAGYIQYEALLDPERGPAATERIATVLQSAGFAVAPKEDLPCIWYKAVKDEVIRLKDWQKYVAGYTMKQRDLWLQNFTDWRAEVADDQELSAILKEYYEYTRDHTYIDIGFQNEGEN